VDELREEPDFLNKKVEWLTGLKSVGRLASDTSFLPDQIVGRENGTFSNPHTDPVGFLIGYLFNRVKFITINHPLNY
jgi:hypothetical protein